MAFREILRLCLSLGRSVLPCAHLLRAASFREEDRALRLLIPPQLGLPWFPPTSLDPELAPRSQPPPTFHPPRGLLLTCPCSYRAEVVPSELVVGESWKLSPHLMALSAVAAKVVAASSQIGLHLRLMERPLLRLVGMV